MASRVLSSVLLLSKTGGENKKEKLMGQDKDREIIYQLLSWAKQTRLEGKEFIAN